MNLIERRRLLLEQCARSVEEQLKQEALNRSPENPIAALADYLGEPYNGLNPDQQRILLQIYMGIRLRESGIPDFQELDNKIAMESLRSAGIDVGFVNYINEFVSQTGPGFDPDRVAKSLRPVPEADAGRVQTILDISDHRPSQKQTGSRGKLFRR